MNSQFSENKEIVAGKKLSTKNNTLEFAGTLKQEMLIPKLASLGIKSSDSRAKPI